MGSKINTPSGPISGGRVSAQAAKKKPPLRGSGGVMHPSFRRGKLEHFPAKLNQFDGAQGLPG